MPTQAIKIITSKGINIGHWIPKPKTIYSALKEHLPKILTNQEIPHVHGYTSENEILKRISTEKSKTIFVDIEEGAIDQFKNIKESVSGLYDTLISNSRVLEGMKDYLSLKKAAEIIKKNREQYNVYAIYHATSYEGAMRAKDIHSIIAIDPLRLDQHQLRDLQLACQDNSRPVYLNLIYPKKNPDKAVRSNFYASLNIRNPAQPK